MIRAKGQRGNVAERVRVLVEPIVAELGFEVWDVCFVKEGSDYFLKVFIDNEAGITIDDCEKVSRAIDGPLDELDPISQNYCLEVCSPGTERELMRDEQFEKFIGSHVIVRLIRPRDDGVREMRGKLASFSRDEISICECDETSFAGNFSILRKNIAFVKVDDFDNWVGRNV